MLNVENGNLYSGVRTRSRDEGPALSLSRSDRALLASSDSGLSVGSQRWTGAWQSKGAAQERCTEAGRLVSGIQSELAQPLLEVMTELASTSRGEGGMAAGVNDSRETSSSERETDILEDGDYAAAHVSDGSTRLCSLLSENLPEVQPDHKAHLWVQQQMVNPRTDNYLTVSVDNMSNGGTAGTAAVVPDTPARGTSSREAVQRGLLDEEAHTPNTQTTLHEQELATTDIDESIEQLNQLILDLDPTFVPVPTRCTPLSRSTSLQINSLSRKGNPHLSGWKQQKQLSNVTDYAGLYSPGWRGGGAESSSHSAAQHEHHYESNSVAHTDVAITVPPTPAFPVSPPTPYVKTFSAFSLLRTVDQWDSSSPDSRGFLDSVNHAATADGELFRSEVSVPSASKIFGSVCSVSSGSPFPHTDSSTPPPVCLDQTPNSHCSSTPPQPSPPLILSTPNASSSPWGAVKGLVGGRRVHMDTDDADLSSLLLQNGSLEQSLLEAMEGLGGLSLRGEGGLPPLLPEKRRAGEVGELGSRSPSLSGFSSPLSGSSLSIPLSSCRTPEYLTGLSGRPSSGAESVSKQDAVKFVQDTSKFWYKADISRDQAISVLKDKEPGAFIVRDSHSFRGAYGLAMKVATPPPSVLQNKKVGDLSNELVRHFLIECTQKGVRLKGCPNEPYFGSLTALVCQHSITPLALPCKLILPDRDPVEETIDSSAQTATNSAAELLKQGAACNVWYLGSVELESLTGHQAVQKATTLTLAMNPPPASTVVHFKVSAQGVTLTDNQRKLFFRRHYAVSTVIFCSLDPQGRKWTRGNASTAKVFGFVARKSQSDTENMCHLFAEHDPEQPASAIVNFVSKVMIGSHKK